MDKILLKTIVLFTALCWPVLSFPQHNGATVVIPSGQGQEPCATMEQDRLLRLKYPQLGELDELEMAIQKKITERENRSRDARTEAVVFTIPIIFHIIHNGESVGTGTNLSAAQIQAQVEVLNEDFRRALGSNGYNTHPDGADIEVEFCLASIDESGNTMSEPGIDRVKGSKAAWTRDAIEGELKPLTIWNPNYYYNVWTLKFDAVDDLLLGYAQFPSQSNLQGLNDIGGPASTDGVVLRYTVAGCASKGNFPVMQAPYNLGRTLVHETGHWLGLRHIWGDGACNADDFVADTPVSSGPHRGCPLGTTSCNSLDMIENYMDYTDDGCMNIFTKGQKARILAVLELSPRRNILGSSPVCGQLTQTAPIANFTADKTQVLLGGTVKFTDLSANFPTSWQWTFEGGNPAASTEKNPVVTYDQPGVYSVSLIATNSIGSSPILDSIGYISVSDQGLCNSLSNFGSGTNSIPRVPTGDGTGFISGHNSLKQQAISEFFTNDAGYVELSGAYVRFGHAFSQNEGSTAKIVVWNALGPQNAPARIIEEKEVLLKQVQEDINAGRPTFIPFDRRVPIFLGTPFHIGVEFNYTGDSLAIVTTADGEANNSSSWTRATDGTWTPYSLRWGLNVAHDITAVVGMKPSVHISPTKLWVYPGQEVTLNGSGASIFTWNASDGSLVNALGPQVSVIPRSTTVYTLTGSGLDLCRDETSITVFVEQPPLGIEEELTTEKVQVYPNPASGEITVAVENIYLGELSIRVFNSLGKEMIVKEYNKQQSLFYQRLDVSSLSAGIYFLQMNMNGSSLVKRLVVR